MEILLDVAGINERVVAPYHVDDLERLLDILKNRKFGTLYLVPHEERFFLVGVSGRVWMAQISRGPQEPLWLSNPYPDGRSKITFNCGNTPTPIAAKFTCRKRDAIIACREFFSATKSIPSGNWIGEWSGLPTRLLY